MFQIEEHLTREILASERPRPTLVYPEAEDPRVLVAASKVLKVANVVLLARPERVRAVVTQQHLRLEGNLERLLLRSRCLLPEDEPELVERFGERLWELSQGKRWELSPAEARQRILDPVHFGLLAVREGFADGIVGGVAHTSRDFFLPCLRLLPKRRTVYATALYALPERHDAGIYRENLVAFADVAVNPEPSAEGLADIAVGACRSLRDLIPESVLPEINGAIISYSTRGSGSGPSVDRIREAGRLIPAMLAELAERDPRYGSIHIEAELQISVAISEIAARAKLKEALEEHPAAGHANVIIVPNLDVGNLLYHIYATRFPDAGTCLMAGGLYARAVDLSRNASVQDIVNSSLAQVLRLHKGENFDRTPHDRFFKRFRILTLNTGRHRTGITVWDGPVPERELTVTHQQVFEGSSAEDLCALVERRRLELEAALLEAGVDCGRLDAVVGRGGLLRPLQGGTYPVDEQMLLDLRAQVGGRHPSNLGGLLAHALAPAAGCPAYVVDPVVVDELDPAFRLTGLAGYERNAAWHSLPQKAVAKRYAEENGKDYADLCLVVAHLGAGISVGAHRNGRVVAVNHALYDGPMTPERAGTLPNHLLFADGPEGCPCHKDEGFLARVTRAGGLRSHLGSASVEEAYARAAAGDEQAALVLQAFVQGIVAEICSRLPWLGGGLPDRVLLTGELALCPELVRDLVDRLAGLGLAVAVYPGNQEMAALRDGVLRVLKGVEQARDYGREVLAHRTGQ